VARGDEFLTSGDIVSARLYYERAANAGNGHAAMLMGETFDPAFLGRAGVRGVRGDADAAATWYRRARDLGDPDAARRFELLDTKQP
jgi:TPR repeat protein